MKEKAILSNPYIKNATAP